MGKVVYAGLLSFAFLFQLASAQASQNQNKFVSMAGQIPASTQNIETCFSPSEQCDLLIIKFIQSAKKSLDVAIYSITHPDIAAAIRDAQKKGIQIRMVVDRTQASGTFSLVNELKLAGIPLKIGDTPGRAIMHNKFTIVDGQALETGSYNYTKNASDFNSENQIYLHDPKIISVYQNDFESLWAKGLAPDAVSNDAKSEGQAID